MPPPSPIYDLIAIELALAVLTLWLAIAFERRFHRWPLITGAVLLLILVLGPEHVWRPIAAIARLLHGLLEHLGLFGLLALIVLTLCLVLAYPTLRRWLRRGGRLP
ncbi:MAG: hypothetical protein C1943_15285 [Halochromatium sp.]|nr:hypothetical protein [Halochromatium sp.]